MLEILVTQKINLFIVYCMISIAVNPIFKEKIVTSEEEQQRRRTKIAVVLWFNYSALRNELWTSGYLRFGEMHLKTDRKAFLTPPWLYFFKV